ncbi:MAG: ANTAR domain-containing response regulator [Magnetovibrionaceae bacterium]
MNSPASDMHIRLFAPVGTSVLLVDVDAERAEVSESMLREQGYAMAGTANNVSDLPAMLQAVSADVVMLHADSIGPDLLETLRTLPENLRCPVVLLSEDGSSESIHAAVAAGVNAYVVVGVNGGRLRSAIDLAKANFSNTTVLREELDEARTALRERKIVERAKGLVMKQKDIDEAEAYELLRKRAMQKGMRLVDVANMINEAADMMGG